MSCYKIVLCGVDLNDERLMENVERIIAAALPLAGNDSSSLHIAHVCDTPVTGYGESTGHHHQMTEAQIRQQYYPLLRPILEHHHLAPCHGHIIFGPTTEAMHRLAGELSCDLIVIGNHNRSILSRLLGSTTNHILQGAPCDVLTVDISE